MRPGINASGTSVKIPEVHFRSLAFNMTEPRDHFINECCFGDDLCRWLIEQFRSRGIETDDTPAQEDFGWYFCFTIEGSKHCLIVGFQANDVATGDRWIAWIERAKGSSARFWGKENTV